MESQSPSGAFPFQAMVEPLVETPPLVHSLPWSCHQLQIWSNITRSQIVKDTESFTAWSCHQVDNGEGICQQSIHHPIQLWNGQIQHAGRLFPTPFHIVFPLMQVKGRVGKRGIGRPDSLLDLAPHSPSPITSFLVLCPPSPYPLFLLFIPSSTSCQHSFICSSRYSCQKWNISS